MKGQAKRFVNHRGMAFSLPFRRKPKDEDSDEDKPVGFFSLWRYGSWTERSLTAAAVVSALLSSCGIAAAVLIYGEVTSLFVSRTKMEDPSPSSSTLLPFFGGAIPVANGSTEEEHKMALIQDTVAFVLASLTVAAVQFTTAAAAVGMANYAAHSMAIRLRIKLLEAVLDQEIAFFDTTKGADILTTMTESVSLIRDGTGAELAQAAFLLGGAVALAAMAAASGWKLALAGLALLPPALIVSAVVAHVVAKWARREGSARAAAARSVREALQHARAVRAARAQTHEAQRFAGLLARWEAAARRRGAASAAGAGAAAALAYSINAIVLALGARLVARDLPLPPEEREYDPGVLVIVLFCTFMSLQQLCLSAPHAERVHVARAAARAPRAVLERGRGGRGGLGGGTRAPDAFRGDVVFDDVYFNYPSRPETKVLRGFSLKICAGQCVCLVGASGSGKSTVLQLLQALYEPLSGSITVDGIPLKELDITHFRRSIGVVGQEPVLFSGSVRSNVCVGARIPLSHADVERAVTLAHAHEFVMQLDKGYETELGSRSALSGGQKQRLCIARALVRRPPLLLLDEPTAALDPRAELTVQAALEAASAGRTTIMVTHRLSTIPADAIVAVVEEGAVREVGKCAELARDLGSAFRAMLDSEGIQLPGLPTVKEESVPSEPATDGDERCPTPLSRQNTLTRGSRLRVSRRLSAGSQWSVRAPAAAALLLAATDPAPEVEVEEEEEEDNTAPSITTMELLRMQWPERWYLAGGCLCAILVGASMPAFAYLFSEIYALFSVSAAAEIVRQSVVFAGYLACVCAAAAAAAAARGWLLAAAARRLTARLALATAAAYIDQEQAWLDRPENSVGALCARLACDCPAVQAATGAALGAALQGASTLLLGGALAAAYSWKMTAASLVAVPLVAGAMWAEARGARGQAARTARADAAGAARAAEAVLHARSVHALGAKEEVVRGYRAAVGAAGAAGARGARGAAGALWASAARGAAFGASVCAPTLGYCGALGAAGHLIARGDMPLHYAILVSEALIYGAWMMSEALAAWPARAPALRAAARLRAHAATTTAYDRNTAPAPAATAPHRTHAPAPARPLHPHWRATGHIEVEDAWVCRGGGSGGGGLQGVSLTVQPGSMVALVGRSGCGKTTLLQLLMRELELSRGRVLLDGIDCSELPVDAVRAQFAYVEQEGALFSRSVRENIAYGATSGASMEEVARAAALTGLHAFIAALPQGYATVMSAGGASVSGGQRQRLGVARALLTPAPVLLLDEPTSALDPRAEQVVMRALVESGRTLVVAAHRLATVRHAHTIYVMERGRIVESGCHEELLEKRGLYHDLWTVQHRGSGHPPGPTVVQQQTNDTSHVPTVMQPATNDTSDVPTVMQTATNDTSDVPTVMQPATNDTSDVPTVMQTATNDTSDVPTVMQTATNYTSDTSDSDAVHCNIQQ